MAVIFETDRYAHLQDVMATLPMTRSYIPFCLAFSTPDSASDSIIITTLRDALDKLADAIPYLAGQVIIEDHVPKIATLKDSTAKPSIELVVKDVRHNVPSLSELSQANFPFSMLDGSLLTPSIASSWTPGKDQGPVITFHANFIHGGLLLGIFANHTQMDCAGMGIITQLLAKALSNIPFTDAELTTANQPRTHILPLLPSTYQSGEDLDDVHTKPTSFTTPTGFALINMSPAPRWIYLNFPAASQARLKHAATASGLLSGVHYITTDDVLCALLWQRINKARHARLGRYSSRLGRVVNVRRHFGLDDAYLGNMGDTVEYSHADEVPIWEDPLGAVASRLRAGLQETEKIRHHMQALATMLSRYEGEEKGKLVFGANMDFNRDLYVSSYTKVFACCEWGEFGPLLGKPLVGRRPHMAGSALPGLIMFMPKDRECGLAVAIALNEADINRLREDEVLGTYAEFLD